jgi:hypothetical protein
MNRDYLKGFLAKTAELNKLANGAANPRLPNGAMFKTKTAPVVAPQPAFRAPAVPPKAVASPVKEPKQAPQGAKANGDADTVNPRLPDSVMFKRK